PKPGSTINEAVEDDLELPTPTAAAVVSYEPEEILKIARQSPAAVAHVVKAWVTDPEEQAS
ncbi:MAG: hypothetical protein WA888_11395, partial [Burkholderiaceae bacterium]